MKTEFRLHKCMVLFGLLVLLGAITTAAGFAETYTSTSKAGLVYRLQGEYLGVIETWGGTWGAQAMATSEKEISIHLLEGGLPGLGFKGKSSIKKCQGRIDSDAQIVQAKVDAVTIVVKPDALEVSDANGQQLGVLTKLIRESKTLGARPPADAIVLFDVDGTNKFVGNKPGEDGLLGVGGISQELFGDHKLHIEFRTPFQPDDAGQQRGNSGVYLQGRYEVQVLDSFGLAGKSNECGGIYEIAKPKINMCFPPLTWQTYDVQFQEAKYDASGKKTQNAKLSVQHNGVTIHQDLELPNATPGKDSESPTQGPLYLQDHGNPVAFRNIWVKKTSN
jgi:hypothetical protein